MAQGCAGTRPPVITTVLPRPPRKNGSAAEADDPGRAQLRL